MFKLFEYAVMWKRLLVLLTCFCMYILPVVSQQRVIVDLDIDSDVDDVSALAMLHTMHNSGNIKLLGVIVTSDDSAAAACVLAINQYFSNGHLPVGVLTNPSNLRHHSKYTKIISEEFPHKQNSPGAIADATDLYRSLLSGSPDASVVVVTIGHLTNFQNLLQSRADRHSKQNGNKLAHRKIKQWICMGGQFPEGKEANFYRPDPGSTVYALNAWKKPVVFAGWEVGQKIVTGGNYLKQKLDATSPVYRAYELYNNFKGRASWDQVAVLLLTDKSSGFFEYVTDGYCEVAPDGSNKWVPGNKRNHAYIKIKPGVDPDVIAKMIDDMVIKEE